jgi:alanine racemase
MTSHERSSGGGVAPIEARLAQAGLPPLPRRSWLEIDLDALAGNARVLRRLLPPTSRLGVVVKADGYGHGMVAAARAALAGGATLLAVATLDEALVLRAAGIGARILVLYPVPPGMLAVATAADLDLVVADQLSVETAIGALRSGASPRLHLGIDSGMSRGGLAPELAATAARRLLDAGLDRLAGTWSHLATPEDPASVAAQVERFEAALVALTSAGIDPGLRHLNATGGTAGGLAPVFDLVRVGLAFYGVLPPELEVPDGALSVLRELRPALSLRARASLLTTIEAGARVGYAGTWAATRRSTVATVAVGYADGWVRAYAPGSWGLVGDRRVPVIGRVSSDALALDVTDAPGYGIEDEVVLLGSEAPAMTVHDLARLRGSISWEVLDNLSPRLSRVYLEDGLPVAVRYLDGETRFAPPSS